MEPVTKHIAAQYDFDTLRAGLEELVEQKLVACKQCPKRGPDAPALHLYNYISIVGTKWTPFMLIARGIVLDVERRKIAALPFPKFFNHNEYPPQEWPEVVAVEDKLDGSLGIAFFDDVLGRWRVNTRGSFQSEQAHRGEEFLAKTDTAHLPRDWTLLFEIVCPESKVVVRYDFEGLRMLAAYETATGIEQHRDALEAVGQAAGIELVQRPAIQTIEDIWQTLETSNGTEMEGFVVKFATGERRKFKGASYVRMHRLVDGVTDRKIWEVMKVAPSADEGLQALKDFAREMPEEFYDEVIETGVDLQTKYKALLAEVQAAHEDTKHLSDKDIGLTFKGSGHGLKVPGGASTLFAMRKSPEKLANILWKLVMPPATVYTPPDEGADKP